MFIKIKESGFLLFLWIGSYAGAGALAAILPLGAPIRIVVMAWLLVSAARSLSPIAGPARVSALALERDSVIELRLGDGTTRAGRFAGGVVYPWAVFLRVRVNGERRTRAMAMWRDSVDAESFRQARVWLRAQIPAA